MTTVFVEQPLASPGLLKNLQAVPVNLGRAAFLSEWRMGHYFNTHLKTA